MKIDSLLTPTRLRIVLIVSIILLAIAGVGIFYLAHNWLSQSASEASAQVNSSKESQTNLDRLQRLEKDLNSKQDATDRASKVSADSKNYNYQDQIINDITTYASRANLEVNNISFLASNTTGTGTPTGDANTESAQATPNLRKTTVDITLKTPVKYRDLLNFLNYIEQNLTKFKISRVSLTNSGDKDDGVGIDVLNLEVNIR